MKNHIAKFAAILACLFIPVFNVCAQDLENTNIPSILEALQYGRAIHIMAMLLIGFGF